MRAFSEFLKLAIFSLLIFCGSVSLEVELTGKDSIAPDAAYVLRDEKFESSSVKFKQSGSEPGLLYPIDSPTRQVKTLDGLWDFRLAPFNDPDVGFREQWYSHPLKLTGEVIPMPVPSSFNDITQERKIRDHVGWVWYETTFVPPTSWTTTPDRVVLHFGSVHYHAMVYINGALATSHTGGHLPFEVEVTCGLSYGQSNRLTVAVNNTLSHHTVPQAEIREDLMSEYAMQHLNFDFFNYAGIHRSVLLYTTPQVYIDDVTFVSKVENVASGTASLEVTVSVESASPGWVCVVTLLDHRGEVKVSGSIPLGSSANKVTLQVTNARLWWPYLMNTDFGYLYDLKLELKTSSGWAVKDVYQLPVGIRQVRWTSTQFLINGSPFYFRGFGKHEDYPVRGKGMDWPFVIKDFNLLHWIGANSFRTSHYPYSEDIVRMADRYGIVIIDEVPGVALSYFNSEALAVHKQMVSELIRRDKNNPSVVMWSLGNECKTNLPEAVPYFRQLTSLTRSMDPTRAVIIVTNQNYTKDLVVESMDVVAVNRYFGWYIEMGHLELIQKGVVDEYTNWHQAFNKPVLVAEYGAGAVVGVHGDPSMAYTEEYQIDLLREHFAAYKTLRSRGYFIGEMIWNFADFMTQQGVSRVYGNRKGIFTRDRQPKSVAFVVQAHHFSLAAEVDKVQVNHTRIRGIGELARCSGL